ncbi:hypothetical protein KUTeg_009647 [Tegillarca granosa]|uniref:Large ribosomal subunit protein mL44 n=1 Tax=Tegillarca granosa TaxID=220873 RepID=A0ABQ9F4G9_TEGGR|nr:hypothetical protein KUTeg_009647 [Tegillarca granosa]
MATFRCFRTGMLVNSSILTCRNTISKQVVRNANKKPKWLSAYLKEQYNRRLAAGPEPERHPEKFGCWNYDCEIYAFGKRFGEEFNENLLKQAFMFSSYVENERARREDLDINLDTDNISIEDNEQLAIKGGEIAERYIKAFLRHSYPLLFEEGICAIQKYLMSDESLHYVASNLGFKDLIKTMEYPPEDDKYCTAFKAVVGALAESQSVQRAEVFVKDFVLPQLIGKDINEMWEVVNPMGLLNSLLTVLGRGAPEPRLLHQSASQTMMAVYHVGIYSDKELIGRSPGESVTIAEEMAAREALKHLMKTSDYRPPLPIGKQAENIKLDYEKKNISLEQLSQKLLQNSEQRITSGIS